MFERHEVDEILALVRSIHHDQLHFRDIFMASIQDVQAAQATETQAIQELSTRIANLPQSVATAADLDGIVAIAQSNTATINGILPAQAA